MIVLWSVGAVDFTQYVLVTDNDFISGETGIQLCQLIVWTRVLLQVICLCIKIGMCSGLLDFLASREMHFTIPKRVNVPFDWLLLCL